ncbi:hypothetical protein Sru01_49760 [Sphaerisporangium rufum]|uniref:Peptidase S8 n=2 Tax=Sphaerisporangium rufum TaxID=1381558 RepID=A0A919V1Q9_9ACTN|nr:hypothetical protein Sru01_49760 [Sphaerisporangium rufum]
MTLRPAVPYRRRRRWRGQALSVAFLLAVLPAMTGAPAVAGGEARRVVVPPVGQPLPNRYIVVLRPGVRPETVIKLIGVKPIFIYTTVLNGFCARMTPQQLTILLREPTVTSVEQDALVGGVPGGGLGMPGAADSAARPAGRPRGAPTTSWGLDRIDQHGGRLNGRYDVRHDGTGITAYIVDSGIDPRNSDLAGRVVPGFDAVGDGRGTGDCLGRGTFAAGLVGGRTFGVAPKVRLVPIRVLNCQGAGSNSAAIAGLDWVGDHLVRPAVASVSLGTLKSPSLDDAVNELNSRQIFLATAAGDHGGNACDVSPASAPGVLTVAASTVRDRPAAFSAGGPCVDIYAPGADVVSAVPGGATRRGSGTALAAAYAAGVGALFKQANGDATAVTIINWMRQSATRGVPAPVPAGTPARLLYTGGL